MCVCVCVRACVRACVCVCVRLCLCTDAYTTEDLVFHWRKDANPVEVNEAISLPEYHLKNVSAIVCSQNINSTGLQARRFYAAFFSETRVPHRREICGANMRKCGTTSRATNYSIKATMHQIPISAAAPPQTPLGELATFPQTP